MEKINDSDIAVVGMSCIFPGAGDLDTYWSNIINKVSVIKTAPNNRIDKLYYDPSSSDLDRLYCNKGGFIDEFMDFDPIEFGIVPNAIKGTEPDHFLSLKLTHRALTDAAIFEKNISLDNAAIIIGKGGYGGVESIKLYETIIGAESIINLLRVTAPTLSEDDLFRIKKSYQKQRGNFGAQNVMGTVPNVVAAIVANRFNFGGPAYTVDAACASSLIAIDNAVKELLTNKCNVAVAGAIHLGQNPALWSVFSLLGAFSKSQVVRPFDKKADGVLPGEGCGFVVLRRLKDAIKDDQRIYAVIKGVGISSDGAHASLMSPSWQGQSKSIINAWRNTNIDFSQIGYVEAHGTATLLGDKTELHTLKEVFPYDGKLPRAGIGSVKSMIGHAMPAAGMAGFIKTVMAVYKGVLPPTLNCDEPVDALNETRFMPVQEAIEWGQTDLPYIAGVNAFGFGGANSHIVIEKFNATNKYHKPYNIPFEKGEDRVILLARNSSIELVEALENPDSEIGVGQYRLALFNPTASRIELAKRIVLKEISWRNKQDLWFTNQPLMTNGGKIAFMFPGLDGPSLLSIEKSNFNDLARFFDQPISDIYQSSEGIKASLALDESARLMDFALRGLGVVPDIVSGHSSGEWTACSTVGMVDKDVISHLNQIALNRDIDTIDALFISVSCNVAQIEHLLEQYKDVYLANDNCPSQIVLCASSVVAEVFKSELVKLGILHYTLPFQTGFHSPLANKYVEEVRHNIETIVNLKAPNAEIWSSITAMPYPSNIEEIKQLHVDFVTHPVLFTQLVENLYKNGVRIFVQIGAGALSGFIPDILKTQDHAIVSSASLKRESLSQLKRVLAALFIEGKDVDVSFLGLNKKTVSKKIKSPLNLKLDLTFPFIDYKEVFSPDDLVKIQSQTLRSSSEVVPQFEPKGVYNVLQQFNRNVEEINRSHKQLLGILGEKQLQEDSKSFMPIVLSNSNELTIDKKERIDISKRIEFSLEKYPELLDHSPFRKESKTFDFSSEREPVVPLTMFIDLFVDTLKQQNPTVSISKVVNVKAYQFLWVTKPTEVVISGKWSDNNTIVFEIENYVKATFILKQTAQLKEVPTLYVSNPENVPISAGDIYEKGYMFHGSAYAGIKEIKAYSATAIQTLIKDVNGKGALLDNVGQTFGLLIHLNNKNLRAFPVGVEEINFFQDPSDQTGEFICTCEVHREDTEFIYGNIELVRAGLRWCYIRNWQVKKSEIDHSIWKMMNFAEDVALTSKIAKGLVIMPYKYKRPNTWFTIMNMYLNKQEIQLYNSYSVAKQRVWLLGRIAAKDAIRDIQNIATHPAIFTVLNDAEGKPFVQQDEKVYISIAHKKEYGVAYASKEKPVGVDIEEIIERDLGFINLVLNDSEKELLNRFKNVDEWIARFWVAKESYGKLTGEGLKGNPKNYCVSNIIGDVLFINDQRITTKRVENYIIGFTN